MASFRKVKKAYKKTAAKGKTLYKQKSRLRPGTTFVRSGTKKKR